MMFHGGVGRHLHITKHVLVLVWVPVFLLFCEKPPAERVIHAEKTLEEAQGIKANLYAVNYYQQAENALAEAKNLIRKKKYGDAAKKATLSMLYARQSIDLTPAGREEYKKRILAELASMEDKLNKLKTLIDKTTNRRKKYHLQTMCEPFIEKWEFQIKSLSTDIENNEPYDSYNTIITHYSKFEKDFKKIEYLLYKKKVKR